MAARRALVGVVTGAALAAVLLLAIVPWDLSEVDARGFDKPSGGDDFGPHVGAVGVIIFAAGSALALSPVWGRLAVAFTAGGLFTWLGLFTWRSAAARTAGANMFMVAVIGLVGPAAMIGTAIVRAIWRRRRTSPEDWGQLRGPGRSG